MVTACRAHPADRGATRPRAVGAALVWSRVAPSRAFSGVTACGARAGGMGGRALMQWRTSVGMHGHPARLPPGPPIIYISLQGLNICRRPALLRCAACWCAPGAVAEPSPRARRTARPPARMHVRGGAPRHARPGDAPLPGRQHTIAYCLSRDHPHCTPSPKPFLTRPFRAISYDPVLGNARAYLLP